MARCVGFTLKSVKQKRKEARKKRKFSQTGENLGNCSSWAMEFTVEFLFCV